MKRYFITGAGTGVGKTLITSTLTWQLRQKNKQVQALKPVASGFTGNIAQTDTGQLLAAQGLPMEPQAIERISPWRFSAPLSPDMASEDEGRRIDFDALVAHCKKNSTADYLFIEGVGGVMTPLTATHTVLDWMAALDIPVILVTGSYVGALSHTLTAYAALKECGLDTHAVVISESQGSEASLARTCDHLQRFLGGARIITIARLDSAQELWKNAPELISLVA